MGKGPVDFTPWGLEATWPSRRWLELVDGRRDGPPKGVWLGHASESAMVLVCTYPRARFDAEMPGTGADHVRELAFEATFALINFALHQVKVPGRRPEGLVGSLVSYASLQADRYQDWGTAHWDIGPAAEPGHNGQPGRAGQPGRGGQPAQAWQHARAWQDAQTTRPGRAWPGAGGPSGLAAQPAGGPRTEIGRETEIGPRVEGAVARTITLGGWRSGFSLADRAAYIVVHACGVSLDHLLLTPVTDPASYGLTADPPLLGDMHWELWPNRQELDYHDLELLVAAH